MSSNVILGSKRSCITLHNERCARKNNKTYWPAAVKGATGTVDLDVGTTNGNKITVLVQSSLGEGNGAG